MKSIKFRLILMNFLQFAIWGSYLITMGSYLASIGMGANIGSFYAMLGIVSLFMPAILGIIADRYLPAEKTLGLSHLISGVLMIGLFAYTQLTPQADLTFTMMYLIYSLSVAFYMPTIALSNAVAYNALDTYGLDTVKEFPPIRVFGTVGFICAMWAVDLMGLAQSNFQFLLSGGISILLAFFAPTLPKCPISDKKDGVDLVEALGLKAFTLFKQKKMALFFIFSMLLGVSLQITNAYADPFIRSFEKLPEYADSFFAQHATILISLSQISETLCILIIPFVLKKFGIRRVMLISMFAWVLRFAFLGLGNPGSGVAFFFLSMIVYGVAFDFFNISGSLFVDKEVSKDMRSSAQGLFVIMTNGLGATLGMFLAQALVIDRFVQPQGMIVNNSLGITIKWDTLLEGWAISWYTFALYALVVTVLFAIFFRYKPSEKLKGA